MASACITELGLTTASVTLAQPSQCDVNDMKIGAYRRMASGTLKGDFVQTPNKRVWNLAWTLLDGTARGVVRTEAVRTGSMRFTTPYDATLYSVLARDYNERPVPSADDSVRWNIRLTLEEL